MKEWKSPELTVLVRSKNEEAVLVACKAGTISGMAAPSDNYMNCQGPDEECSGCHGISDS